MKKISLLIGIAVALILPACVFANVSDDTFTATSTSLASTFPYASTTAISADTISAGSIYDTNLATPAGTLTAIDPTGHLVATSSGAVSSVTSATSSLIFTILSGIVNGSLNLAHSNIFTVAQSISGNVSGALDYTVTNMNNGILSSARMRVQNNLLHLGYLMITASNYLANGTIKPDQMNIVNDTASNGMLFVNINGAQPIVYSTDKNTTDLVLTATHNAGFGTTTPGVKLDVFSTGTTTARLDSNSSSKGGCLVIKDVDGIGYTYLTTEAGVPTYSTTSCK